MRKTVHKITLIFSGLTFISFFLLTANPDINFTSPVEEGVFRKSIASVMIHREGWRLSYPIIELNGDTRLEIRFDDLTNIVNNYSYKVIHCDHNWIPSLLNEYEYIDGLLQNQILQYSLSFNTYINYVHFKLTIPNEDINFKLSGNYALLVYEDFDEDRIAFIKRFVITETKAEVRSVVKRPMLNIHRNTGQETDFSIIHGNYPINDPFSEIHVKILQNGRWDNAIEDLKPLFTKDGILDYDYDMENIFNGGSEFRWFDIKSMRYQSPYIRNVIFKDGNFHAYLFPDEYRAGKQYFFEDDLNGKYYIEVQEQPNSDTDADYVYVYFSIPFDAPFIHGRLFVMGALTNWVFNQSNEMKYNFETKSYELVLLLKQGYYNYQYAFIPDNQKTADLSHTEGNHYETENDYIILVYHRPQNSRYDRIIGYQIFNSIHNRN